ncbi:MAG: MarR family winged helix-turn-helix transcriptional regulator [bacterium]
MARTASSKEILARRAWALMFDYLMATSPDRARLLERRGLTPNDARALWSLEPGDGRPIGSLAREWGCDPANATFIIGRLETAGLAQRSEGAHDRRVKLVALTRKGAAIKQALLRAYRRPPPELDRLAHTELAELIAIFEKLVGA